jgi:hypothetical protein
MLIVIAWDGLEYTIFVVFKCRTVQVTREDVSALLLEETLIIVSVDAFGALLICNTFSTNVLFFGNDHKKVSRGHPRVSKDLLLWFVGDRVRSCR